MVWGLPLAFVCEVAAPFWLWEGGMIFRLITSFTGFVDKCKRDKINAYAAQSAFFIILSAIPFLMAFSSLLRYTFLTEDIVVTFMRGILPEYISPFLISLVHEVYNRSAGLISVTAVVAIWSAARGVLYISDGLNAVNGLEETRSWIVIRLRAVFYTLIFLVAIVFILIVLVFGNSLRKVAVSYVPVLGHVVTLISKMRGLFMLGVFTLFFDIMFTALPNRKVTFKSQLPGAAICAVAWYAYSFGLSIYVDYFNGYSMYGSLTTIALVMLWLYFCMYIMLLSAEVNVVFNELFKRWYNGWKGRKRG